MPSTELVLASKLFSIVVNVVGGGGPTVSQTKTYADAEDAEFQLGADLEERGGMACCGIKLALVLRRGDMVLGGSRHPACPELLPVCVDCSSDVAHQMPVGVTLCVCVLNGEHRPC